MSARARPTERSTCALEPAPVCAPRLQITLARTEAEVRAAQRLRWQVFAEEMGARLATPQPGLDIDRYDGHCDHLLVRQAATGEVVGTYRLLGADAARRLGGYYIEQEFELGRLDAGRGRLLELGRCCVRADHRRGAVLALLWSGLADYLRTRPHDHLIGCASIPLRDPAYGAVAIWHSLRRTHLSPAAWRATPRRPLPLPERPLPMDRPDAPPPALPPLLKGYLRAGGQLCGAPALDTDFHTADLPMLLVMTRLNPAHARHFLHP